MLQTKSINSETILKDTALQPLTPVSVPVAQVVAHPLRDRKVMGSIPDRVIPKELKLVYLS